MSYLEVPLAADDPAIFVLGEARPAEEGTQAVDHHRPLKVVPPVPPRHALRHGHPRSLLPPPDLHAKVIVQQLR